VHTTVGRLLWVLLLITPALALDDLPRSWQRSVQNNELSLIRDQMQRMDDIDLPTINGKTALMAAARQGDADLVQALLALNAEVNAENRAAGTPLLYAVWSGDENTVRTMLNHGAHINHQSANGWTALMMAAAKNHPQATRLLLERGADAQLVDIYGWTPLMRAAYAGHQEVVQLLLQLADSELERHNDHGQTALHLAVIQGHEQVVLALLQHGARPNAEDFAGYTPLSIAHTTHHSTLLSLLQNFASERP